MHHVHDIDWSTWSPNLRATLLFVRRDGHLLLIRKKTGFGRGKINAPGGKLDPGETPLEAASRELTEEVGVVAKAPRQVGELFFQFTDGLRMQVWVFLADDCEGTPVETREALPMWVPVDAIPYEEMWADDAVWVPHMLAGRRFTLRAVFDGDVMLDHAIEVEDRVGQPARPVEG